MNRVGIGYDAHRLTSGRRLVLGGVEIPFHLGLDGHSDADVLAHAVADALLGAAGCGELGELYPASSPRWRDCSSMLLLAGVGERLRSRKWTVVNIDAVVVADAPRLSEYRETMCRNIADALMIDVRQISVKPKSNEGLGFEGRSEGMSARAVALVEGGS